MADTKKKGVPKNKEQINLISVLENLFDNLLDPVFLYDNNDNFIYVNKAFARFHGLEKQNIIGKHVKELFPSNLVDMFIDEHIEVKKNLKEKISEYPIEDIDGNEVIALSSVAPFINKDGKILGVFGFSRNITNLKNLEKILRQKDVNLKFANDILMKAPDLIFYIDRDNRYQFVNEKFSEMNGLPINEIVGKTNQELFTDERMVAYFDKTNEEVYQKGAEITFESNLTINNRKVIVKTAKRPFIDEHDQLLGIIGVGRDITAERLLEQKLLSNQRIESLGYLANTFSHDYNNLLGGISGFVQLLLLKETDSEKITYLEKIQGILEKGNEITKEIMHLSDIGIVDKEDIKINELIPDVVSLVKNSIEQKIDVKLSLESQLSAISGDTTQIFQALINILTNAVESMPDGGLIEVKTYDKITDLEKDKQVIIEIIDHGTGINEEDLSKIFDPFFSTKLPKESYSTTGLGLAIVHRIIQNHNGSIEVESSLGFGTTFRISLPLNASLQSKPPLASKTSAKEKILARKSIKKSKRLTKKPTKEKLILIIEDNEDLLEILKIRFQRKNMSGLFSNDPVKGIELYKKNMDSIGLVILDYLMPSMTGLDVFNKLKEIRSDIKVIITTGFAKDIIKTKDEGILEIMTKPLNYDYFFEKIDAIMQ